MLERVARGGDDHRMPEHLLDKLILAAETAVRLRNSTLQETFKMTEIQYRLIAHLGEHRSVSMTKLANLVNRDVAQVSRTVRGLVENGLVRTSRAPGAPCMAIELTTHGQHRYWHMDQVGAKLDVEIRALMSEKQLDDAANAIEQLYSGARRVSDEDRRES